jgi:hypothetical protein
MPCNSANSLVTSDASCTAEASDGVIFICKKVIAMNDNAMNMSAFLLLIAILATLCLLIGTPAKADTYFGDYCKEDYMAGNSIAVKYERADIFDSGAYVLTGMMDIENVYLSFETTKEIYKYVTGKLKGGEIIDVEYDIKRVVEVPYGVKVKECTDKILATSVKVLKEETEPGYSVPFFTTVLGFGLIQGRYDGRNEESELDIIDLTLEDGRALYFVVGENVNANAFNEKAVGKQAVIYYETLAFPNEGNVVISDFFKLGKVVK